MARIRSIKPEFWSDYRMAKELSREVRLFYIALWNAADDEGRFVAHPRKVLGECFPYDEDLQVKHINGWMKQLVETGRLVLYKVNNEPYGQLTKFGPHQHINRPSPSRFPAPPDQGGVTEPSVNAHGKAHDSVTEGSVPARKDQGSGIRDQGSGGTDQGVVTEVTPRTRRTDLSTWGPLERHAELAKTERLNLAREEAKFRAFAPNRKHPYRDLDAGFTQWLLNARSFNKNGNGDHHEPAEPPPRKPDEIDRWKLEHPDEYASIEAEELQSFERTNWWAKEKPESQQSQLRTAVKTAIIERIRGQATGVPP